MTHDLTPTDAALCERLNAAMAACLKRDHGTEDWDDLEMEAIFNACRESRARIEALSAALKKARPILAEFAAGVYAADYWIDDVLPDWELPIPGSKSVDDNPPRARFTTEHLRRAAHALAEIDALLEGK